LLVKVSMEPVDQFRDLWTHNRQDVRAARRGNVLAPPGDDDEAARRHSSPRAFDRHRKVALEADERLSPAWWMCFGAWSPS
jgi:hypothetical protein